MKDFQLETRTNFPSDKFTLDFANIIGSKRLLWLNVYLELDGKNHDVDLLLEDSLREIFNKQLDLQS